MSPMLISSAESRREFRKNGDRLVTPNPITLVTSLAKVSCTSSSGGSVYSDAMHSRRPLMKWFVDSTAQKFYES